MKYVVGDPNFASRDQVREIESEFAYSYIEKKIGIDFTSREL